MLLLTSLCKELHAENFEDLLGRVKEAKEGLRRARKESKLIVNLQQMAKDCINRDADLMGTGAMKERKADAENKMATIKSNRKNNTINNTINDINNVQVKSDLLPLKEVWRWLKSLVHSFYL